MSDLSAHSLMIAIQAVNNEVKKLAEEIEAADDPELSDLEELMLEYAKTEIELKNAYIERQKKADNLPPYDQLFPATS